MTPEQFYIYTEEVYIHAHAALSNYTTFQNIVADPRLRQRREAWGFLQSFLSHFGMVSKLLYAPSAKKQISKDRAEELRNYLETDENSALNDRCARNAMEHLDERLDNWLSQKDKSILECVFEDRAGYDFLQKDKWAIRRVFLIEEKIFMTQDNNAPKEMQLEPIIAELGRIYNLSSQKLDENNPYNMVFPNNG